MIETLFDVLGAVLRAYLQIVAFGLFALFALQVVDSVWERWSAWRDGRPRRPTRGLLSDDAEKLRQ